MQSMEGKYLYIMYLPNGLFQNVGVVRYQTVSSLSKKFWRSYSKLVLKIAYLKKIHYIASMDLALVLYNSIWMTWSKKIEIYTHVNR